ncbi:MAG TPA: response regulator, partial [Candidatus Hydrogenedentes bacterium]|nr:response regulator [Candidatus Hydrogenedentota bacterium]
MPEHTATAEILLVERAPETARRIISYLDEHGYAVEWVDDGEKAFNRLDDRTFDVLITELNAHRIKGMRLLELALERSP